MGKLDWLFRRGKKEPEVAYYLQFQPKGQKGWVPVERFTFPVSPEDAKEYMVEPGVYNLQKREGGRISGYAWKDPYVVKGDGEKGLVTERVPGMTDSDRIAQAIESDMTRAVRWFKLPKLIQQAIRSAFGEEGNPIESMAAGGGAAVTAKSLRDTIKELRDEYSDLREIFGSSTDTQSKKIPVKGDVPAWLVYLPEIVDQVGDNVEKRLERFGLIGEKKSHRRLLNMPERPKKKVRVDLGKLKEETSSKKKGAEKRGEKTGK